MLSSRRTLTAIAASFTLGGAILVTSCQPDDPAGPSVTGVQLAKGGGGGGGPKVNAADPPSAPPDTTLDVRVLGSGFDNGSAASFTINGNPQAEFRTNSTTFISKNELVANVTIDLTAQIELYDVEVLSTRGKKGVGADLFAVVAPELADPAIVFTTQGTVDDLRVMNASGAHEAVVFSGTFVASPTWSPTGSQIVFKAAPFDVLMIDITIGPDGEPQGGPPVIILDRSFGLGFPAWSPAGNEIALRGTGTLNAPTVSEPSSIWVIQPDGSGVFQPDGSGLTRLYNAPVGRNVAYPAWSPDGTRLAFVEQLSTGGRIIKVILRSTGAVETTLLAGQFENIRELDWQRTSGAVEIAFAARTGGRRPKDRKYFVYTLATTAGSAATPTQIIEGRHPAWSPNDQELLFSSENNKLQIVTLGEGGGIRTVSTTNGFHEEWRR